MPTRKAPLTKALQTHHRLQAPNPLTEPLNPKALNPKLLNPEPLNPKPLNPKPSTLKP